MPSDTVMLVGAFIPIVGILIGGLLLLVPIAGLTLRFALKPALEAYTLTRQNSVEAEEIRLLHQRLALVEDQLRTLSTRLIEDGRRREWDAAQPPPIQMPRIVGAPEAAAADDAPQR